MGDIWHLTHKTGPLSSKWMNLLVCYFVLFEVLLRTVKKFRFIKCIILFGQWPSSSMTSETLNFRTIRHLRGLDPGMSFNRGFPGGTNDKEPACQGRRYKRHGFDPWVRKIPWRRAQQPTPIFILPWKTSWTEEPGGLQSRTCKESDTTDVT